MCKAISTKHIWAHVLGTARFILLDSSGAHEHFANPLNHLMAMRKSGKIPPQKEQLKVSQSDENLFVSGKAEEILWTTCAKLAKLDIPAFPFAGTLLGLVRNGCLLDFDKDLDIAVRMESWNSCCNALEQAGWIRSSMRIDYANYRDYVHPELGITLDVCGLQAREKQIVGGFSLPGYPDEYQRVAQPKARSVVSAAHRSLHFRIRAFLPRCKRATIARFRRVPGGAHR